jgi:subtilisin family serine protease
MAWVTVLVLASSADAARYVIVYERQNVPADAAERIARAGGQLVAEYDAIGVAVADGPEATFAGRVARDERVRAVTLDAPIAENVGELVAEGERSEGDLPNSPAQDADTFSPLQWNMRQIHAPEAHAITGGSSEVHVAVIDTGIEPAHPDLVQNLDEDKSTSCVPPSQPPLSPAWRDDNGHGTHNAGTIAAAANGIGIVGVAPNVRIAAVKAGNAANQFFAIPVICAFEWVAAQHFDVANASFNVDGPVFSYCHNNPAQQMLWKAVKRSVRHALRAGVTVVASAGNNNLDITHPDYDGDGDIDNECVRAPSEIPGVVTVAATGIEDRKASYSNYGLGYIDVAAPGGDPAQVAAPPFNVAPINVVLSTWPAALWSPTIICDPLGGSTFPPFPPIPACPREAAGVAYYRYMAGTSVAAAHVSGVAALVVSVYGDDATLENGKMRPGQVEAIIEQTADPRPCPPEPTTCQGGEGYNGWYGHGRVNALRAVTYDSGA